MFSEFLKQNNITQKELAVGVSGGSDSLALVLMAQEELAPLGYRLVALTVNHGLRPSAAKEAKYVQTLMKQYGIEHHTLVWKGLKPQTGVEEAARLARYELLADWCLKHQIKVLMTAHHLYDQAETFLMRLQRGSGLDGLCSMSPVAKWPGVKLARPFLNTPPEVMKNYLSARHIHWITDESNADDKLLRVKMRQALPLLEKLGISALKISETAARLQKTQKYLQQITDENFQKIFISYGNFAFSCLKSDYVLLDEEMRYRLLVKLIREVGKNPYPPRAERLLKLDASLQAESFKAATLGHCAVRCFNQQLWFFPEKAAVLGSAHKVWKKYLQTHPKLKKAKIPSALRAWYVTTES